MANYLEQLKRKKSDGTYDNIYPITTAQAIVNSNGTSMQSLFDEKENVANKVTSINASSTDTQYPSAKVVYTAIANLVPNHAKALETPITLWGNQFDGSTGLSGTISFGSTGASVYGDSTNGAVLKFSDNFINVNGTGVFYNGDKGLWHSGNFTPSDYLKTSVASSTYLSLTGGTLTGPLTTDNITANKTIVTNDSVKIKDLTYTDNIEDILSYGISWTENQTSPVATRIGNPNFHRTLPIQSQMKGCVYNGKNIIYYLNPQNWAVTDHAGPSRLDGTDGSIGIHIPKWYIKSGQEGTTKYVRISTINVDGTYKEVPECIIGFSKCTLDRTNSKTATVINTSVQYRGGANTAALDQYLEDNPWKSCLGKPVTNITRNTMRTYARAAGEELLSYEMYSYLYWLYMIEYANFNSQDQFNSSLDANGYHQGGMGNGITNIPSAKQWSDYAGGIYVPICPIGYTNSFGNGSGVVDITIPAGTYNGAAYSALTVWANRWRGLENLFGELWTNLDGFVAVGDVDNQRWYYYSDPEKFSDTAGSYTGSIYAGNMTGLNDSKTILDWNMSYNSVLKPSATSGTAGGKYDMIQFSFGSGAYGLLAGGQAAVGAAGGLGSLSSGYVVSLASVVVGFRTMVLL